MTEWGLLSWEGVGRGTVHRWRVVVRQTGIQDKVIKTRVFFNSFASHNVPLPCCLLPQSENKSAHETISCQRFYTRPRSEIKV